MPSGYLTASHEALLLSLVTHHATVFSQRLALIGSPKWAPHRHIPTGKLGGSRVELSFQLPEGPTSQTDGALSTVAGHRRGNNDPTIPHRG